jgi:hypothetical protein
MLSDIRKEIERCKELVERSMTKTVSLPTAASSGDTTNSNRNKRGPASALEKAWELEDHKQLDVVEQFILEGYLSIF